MAIRLRGHHLLCLLGYRGMGYSDEYVRNMSKVHQQLREHPQTLVQLVTGPDDLCAYFPCNQPNHCQEDTVHQRDRNIAQALGLDTDEAIPWQEIEERVAARLVPSDIPQFCSTCPWLPYGVCEEGITVVRNGGGLRPLPEATSSER